MKSFDELYTEVMRDKSIPAIGVFQEIAKRYARQTAENALQRAAVRATGEALNGKVVIEKSSILTTEIRLG